jgi:hypothetical protein
MQLDSSVPRQSDWAANRAMINLDPSSSGIVIRICEFGRISPEK